tara:strand:- start:1309 stop:1569 length:261 start_codon:yes stop_codon:yes gene_type:complete
MTGFNSKRKAAQAKLDEDDDTQVYADTLLIVYQRGFADGKRSAQRKPLTATTILNMMPSTVPAEYDGPLMEFARALEAAHNIKEGT